MKLEPHQASLCSAWENCRTSLEMAASAKNAMEYFLHLVRFHGIWTGIASVHQALQNPCNQLLETLRHQSSRQANPCPGLSAQPEDMVLSLHQPSRIP